MEAEDVIIMKIFATLLFFFLFLTGAFSQTRNVLVNTSSVVVQPTNFWSADASNARTGLGLVAYTTNPIVPITNGGTGATNASTARTNFGLGVTNNVSFGSVTTGDMVYGDGTITWNGAYISLEERTIDNGGSGNWTFNQAVQFNNAAATRTNLGLGSTNDVRFKSIILQDSGGVSNNITYGGEGLEFYTEGQLFLATEDSFGVAFYKPIYFPTNTNSASITRTNLELGSSWLTNTNAANFRSDIGLGLTALTNTNIVNFRSDIGLGLTVLTNTNISDFRSSIGLGLEALTNTNNSNFLASFFGSNTNPVLVNTNGTVVSPTNFWQVAPIQTLVQTFAPSVSSNSYGTNARNLYVYSMATSISGVTNTVVLPTNSATFDGDAATVTHKGTTSSVTAVRQAGSATNFTTISNEDESVKFIREGGQWTFYHNISYVEPIRFADGNIEDNKAASRTNLGLGFAALTNTNAAGFQRAIFSTNSVPSNSANINTINFNTAVAWMEVSVITNGATNSYRIPLFQ